MGRCFRLLPTSTYWNWRSNFKTPRGIRKFLRQITKATDISYELLSFISELEVLSMQYFLYTMITTCRSPVAEVKKVTEHLWMSLQRPLISSNSLVLLSLIYSLIIRANNISTFVVYIQITISISVALS